MPVGWRLVYCAGAGKAGSGRAMMIRRCGRERVETGRGTDSAELWAKACAIWIAKDYRQLLSLDMQLYARPSELLRSGVGATSSSPLLHHRPNVGHRWGVAPANARICTALFGNYFRQSAEPGQHAWECGYTEGSRWNMCGYVKVHEHADSKL